MSFEEFIESTKYNLSNVKKSLTLFLFPDLKTKDYFELRTAEIILELLMKNIVKYLNFVSREDKNFSDIVCFKFDEDMNLTAYFNGLKRETNVFRGKRILQNENKPAYCLYCLKFNGEKIDENAQVLRELFVYEPQNGYVSKGYENIINTKDKDQFVEDFTKVKEQVKEYTSNKIDSEINGYTVSKKYEKYFNVNGTLKNEIFDEISKSAQ